MIPKAIKICGLKDPLSCPVFPRFFFGVFTANNDLTCEVFFVKLEPKYFGEQILGMAL